MTIISVRKLNNGANKGNILFPPEKIGGIEMRVPVISLIIVSIVVGLSIPAFADREQANEEQRYVEDLKKAAIETIGIKTETIKDNLTVEFDKGFKEKPCISEKYVSKYDFDILREENEDIIAWINVPGTNIDYPVLFDGTDKYLYTNLNGKDSASGSIYVDAAASNVLDDAINIIYGHHMKSGSMFADIDEFSEKDFWDEHQEINIFMEDRELRLHPVMGVVGVSDVSLKEVQDVETLKKFCKGKTIVNGEIPEEWSQMYVLITCNYTGENYRTYLFCSR